MGRLSNHRYTSEKCKQGEEICLRRKTLQRYFDASMVSFQINANTLLPSEAFTYLGQTITYKKRDWAAVYLNQQKARRRWGMISRVLERTGATVRAQGEIYKAVAPSVLLYGSDSWVVNGETLKVLTEFHHRAERRITGMTAKCGTGREWDQVDIGVRTHARTHARTY